MPIRCNGLQRNRVCSMFSVGGRLLTRSDNVTTIPLFQKISSRASSIQKTALYRSWMMENYWIKRSRG